MRANQLNKNHPGESNMTSSISVLTWCFRAVYREDPRLRRIARLKGCLTDPAKANVPVFLTRKATIA